MGAPEDVALECFFGAQNGPVQFVGVRLARLDPASRREAIRRLAARYLDGPMSLHAARNVLQSCLGGAPLWSTRPDFLELGMLDAWSSYGRLRFWTAGAALPPAAALRRAVEGQPRFHGFTDLPLAIEAGVLGPLPQWRGIVVSEPHAQGWLADFQRAGSVAEALALSGG